MSTELAVSESVPVTDGEEETGNSLTQVSQLYILVHLPDSLGKVYFEKPLIQDNIISLITKALKEHPHSCIYTSYHLEVDIAELEASSNLSDGNKDSSNVLTTKNNTMTTISKNERRVEAASVSERYILKEDIAIEGNEMYEKIFTMIMKKVLSGELLNLYMVFDNYDIHRIKDHVQAFRTTLANHPPVTSSIIRSLARIATISKEGNTKPLATLLARFSKDESSSTSDESLSPSVTITSSTPTDATAKDTQTAEEYPEQPEAKEEEEEKTTTQTKDTDTDPDTDKELVGLKLLQHVESRRENMRTALTTITSIDIPVPLIPKDLYPVPLPLHIYEEVKAALNDNPGPMYTAPSSGATEKKPNPKQPDDSTSISSAALSTKSGNLLKLMMEHRIDPYPSIDNNNATIVSSGKMEASTMDIKCIHSITYSGWNPPPPPRRMQGDLLYLEIQTLENRTYYVTATATGFFINRTANNKVFDPLPAPQPYTSRSLWILLQRISPSFRANYIQLLMKAALHIDRSLQYTKTTTEQDPLALALQPLLAYGTRDTTLINIHDTRIYAPSSVSSLMTGNMVMDEDDIFGDSNVQTFSNNLSTSSATYGIAVPPVENRLALGARAPWLVPSLSSSVGPEKKIVTAGEKSKGTSIVPTVKTNDTIVHYNHSYDPSRCEDDLLWMNGMNNRGNMRDWNEEWQTCKDLPIETVQDRMIRSRAMVKVIADFTEAATQGAMGIVQGNILPISPRSSTDLYTNVYLYNGIFFSYSLDSRSKEKLLNEKRKKKYNGTTTIETMTVDGSGTASPIPDDITYLSSSHHDLQGIIAVNEADIPNVHTLLTTLVHYNGYEFVAQGIIPGILHSDKASTIVYGFSDNNNNAPAVKDASNTSSNVSSSSVAKRTVMIDPTMNETMHSLADKLYLHEQSISTKYQLASSVNESTSTTFIGPYECKGVRGSDNRLYIMDLIRMTPRDPVWYDALLDEQLKSNRKTEETKMEKETNTVYTSIDYGTEIMDHPYEAIFRPELIRKHAQVQTLVDKTEPKKDEKSTNNGTEELSVSASTVTKSIAFDVNAFTAHNEGIDSTVRKEQEEKIRKLSQYLVDQVVPALFNEIRRESSMPLDGESLTRILHARGMNVRYLGRLADLAAMGEQIGLAEPALLELIETEMVARIVRRILDEILRDSDCKGAPAIAISMFLNTLFGLPEKNETNTGSSTGNNVTTDNDDITGSTNKKKNKAKGKDETSTTDSFSSDAAVTSGSVSTLTNVPSAASLIMKYCTDAPRNLDSLTPDEVCRQTMKKKFNFSSASLWELIQQEITYKFRCDLRIWKQGGYYKPATNTSSANETSAAETKDYLVFYRCPRIALLRRITQKCGIQLLARNYLFPTLDDLSSSSPSPVPLVIFTSDDIQGIIPTVKSCYSSQFNKDSIDLYDNGQLALSKGQISEAFTYIQESLLLFHQIYGSLTREVAMASTTLALILWNVDEREAAIVRQQRAVLIYEYLYGPDHADTAHAHSILGTYLAEIGATNSAIRHIQRCIFIQQLITSYNHPETVQMYIRLGTIYNQIHHIPMAIECYDEALHRSAYSVSHVATCSRLIGNAYAHIGQYREALAYTKRGYTIIKENYGKNAAPEVLQEYEAAIDLYLSRAVDYEKSQNALVSMAEAFMQSSSEGSPLEMDEPTSSEKMEKQKQRNSNNNNKQKGRKGRK